MNDDEVIGINEQVAAPKQYTKLTVEMLEEFLKDLSTQNEEEEPSRKPYIIHYPFVYEELKKILENDKSKYVNHSTERTCEEDKQTKKGKQQKQSCNRRKQTRRGKK